MFDLVSAKCTVRMCSTCRLFSVIPLTFWPFILHFSLLFPFLHTFSLFSLHFRVCLFFKLSFSVLHFLVRPSCSSLFLCSSFVDYSSIRVDCPLIAFLFAHLGCLLEVMEGECLKRVSFFMREDCLYRFVLSSLFPLVSCFVKVAKLLKMSGEVRSSELEAGLSLPDDHVVPEFTSPSTPYKAWNIPCAFLGKDEKQIRDRFQFPDSVRIRIPSDEDRVCHSYADEVCVYEADFTGGLRLPVKPFVRELFAYLHLASAQLVPNSWRIVISYMVV